MDKTMTRFLAILAALTCVASAQTYKTVTADTNNVIRTNFSLVRSQVSDLSGASFAISNITGLQTALDGKVATNGSATGLTNFPAIVLQTNSSLSAFPQGLLRTNGDGGALTNLPNANLSNAIGVLPVSNGGSGATNADLARTNFGLVWSGLTNSDATSFRTALSLGTAATNDFTAFQPASSALTNLANNDASALTNFSAAVLLSNSSLSSFPAGLLRTNGDGSGLTGIAVFPSYTNNAQKVLAVTTNESGVEWVAVSNTVTDASTLTNFPAYILQTGSAETNFPAFLLRTNGSGAGLTSITAANITGTVALASNVSGTIAISNGGTGGTTASNARVNLLPSYTGNASKVLALNSSANDVEWVTQTGGGSGTVTSVAMTVPAFLSVSGSPITTNGTFVVSLNTNALPLTNGGTGATNAATALTNLGVLQLSDKTLLGAGASTTQNESTVIGANAKSFVIFGTAVGSDALVTNGNYASAFGFDATATGQRSIALGSEASVTASNAIQIGVGTNTNALTVQFLNAGSVNETEWGYLASASTKGGSRMTNTNGVTVTNTIIGYDGTNYTTNTITVIDGIITSWTQ